MVAGVRAWLLAAAVLLPGCAGLADAGDGPAPPPSLLGSYQLTVTFDP